MLTKTLGVVGWGSGRQSFIPTIPTIPTVPTIPTIPTPWGCSKLKPGECMENVQRVNEEFTENVLRMYVECTENVRIMYIFLVTSSTGKCILYFQLPDPSGTMQNNF